MNARANPIFYSWLIGLVLPLLAVALQGESPPPLLGRGDDSPGRLPKTMLPVEYTEPTSLLWRNGETIAGSLEGVVSGHLLWRMPFFEAPLEIKADVIERVNFRTRNYLAPQESFRVLLSNGSHLTGEISNIENGTLVFASNLAGELKISTDQVVAIERIDGAEICTSSAQALLVGNQRNDNVPNHWMLTADRKVASPSFNDTLEPPVTLSPRAS